MPGKIFINYRRGDDPGFAQALLGRLEQAFPTDQLFMDVDNIEPGLDFVRVLAEQVAQCDVLISVIGKNWTESRDETGARRLDNPEDFVRIEIESALTQEKRVIPVLVGQATMPRPDELPEPMKPLARRNAVRLTHERFRADTEALIGALQRALKNAEEARAARQAERERQEQADRLRQESEAKQHADEQARQKTEEERQKQEAEADRIRIAALEAKAQDEEALRQRQAQVRQEKAEAEQRSADARRAREEAEIKRRAEAEERRQLRRSEGRTLWPPSRGALAAVSFVGLVLVGAVGAWFALWPMPIRPTTLSAAQEQALKPKDTFQECTKCPVMVVAPAGSFIMGSPTNEPGRDSDEGPQHTVTIARQFAVGQQELTFDQWDACVAEGGCNAYKPSDQGWGGGQRPVINISRTDASAYVTWLAKKTGKPYRLLSEAEYEYAMRAGSATAYPWGDVVGQNNANCNGCGTQWDNKQTAPVGSFAANGFGLYDMAGNVWEWTDDCYHENYAGAPTDGSAWTKGDCSRRVLRGGSWDNYARFIRSAVRDGLSAELRNSDFGFRVGRTLATP